MISSENSSPIDEPRALAASLIESLNSNSDVHSILKLRELLDQGHDLKNSILINLNKSCKGFYYCINILDLSSSLSQAVNTLDIATRSLEQQKYKVEQQDLTTEQTELNDALASTKANIDATNMEIEKTLKELNAIEKQARLEAEAPPDSQV
jgi:DNA gyrase/topoisomerase IV subunit A